MKIFLPCPSCKNQITPTMTAAIKEGKCPFCGNSFDVADLPSAFLVIQTIQELKLPLSAQQVTTFLATLLKTKMEMTFPDIVIEAEPADLIRAKAGNKIPELQQPLGLPEAPGKTLGEDDFDDENLSREESVSADTATVSHFKGPRVKKDKQGNIIYTNTAAVAGKKERSTGEDAGIIFGPYGAPGNTPESTEGRQSLLHIPPGYRKQSTPRKALPTMNPIPPNGDDSDV